MKKKVSNVNFFVIDKYGNHIYKNYVYSKIPGKQHKCKNVSSSSVGSKYNGYENKKKKLWLKRYTKTRVFYPLKLFFVLLIIMLKALIGLSVDIVDRKKLESLAERVAQDIRSSLVALSMFYKEL
ncbi:MAG: hypothetical protein LE168_02385 [Endomicrobium sp.]|nr:hypothetical protein [Endomicrobium sp.]